MQWGEPGRGSGLGFTEKDFKVCDLCGALNLVTNNKCFVCSWMGRFHTDKESVRTAIMELEQAHGQLSERIFSEEILPDDSPPANSWLESLLVKLRRFVQGDG